MLDVELSVKPVRESSNVQVKPYMETLLVKNLAYT